MNVCVRFDRSLHAHFGYLTNYLQLWLFTLNSMHFVLLHFFLVDIVTLSVCVTNKRFIFTQTPRNIAIITHIPFKNTTLHHTTRNTHTSLLRCLHYRCWSNFHWQPPARTDNFPRAQAQWWNPRSLSAQAESPTQDGRWNQGFLFLRQGSVIARV